MTNMKYLIKRYILSSNKWNESTQCFQKCEDYLYNPCGSSHSNVIADLKTLRGVINRVNKWYIQENVKKIEICNYDNDQILYTIYK